MLIVRGVDSFVGFPGFDDAVTNLLDNPAWHALTGRQASQGERREQAARYQPEISPLGAVRECTTDALDELATLCGRDPVALLCDTRELPRHRFRLVRTNVVRQLCCEAPCEPLAVPAVPLRGNDAADMVALVKLTEPGPFAPRTVELGSYVGVRDDGGHLLAMAGERLKPPGWVEVSGVCTHPDGRGRGYAIALVSQVTNAIFARGERAFLYVAIGSPSEKTATRIYEQLGFRFQRQQYVHVLLPQSG